MASVNLRVAEGCAPDATLSWDTVWNPAQGYGDWGVAGPAETGNIGGLRATAALATAVVLCLFSDAPCPPDHPLAKFADGDRRGWWGDAVDLRQDLGEVPLGSLWWLLERSAIDPVDTPRWVEAMGIDALQPLVDQGVCVRTSVTATVDPTRNRCDVDVELFGQNGTSLYKQRFANIWAQLGRN